MLTRLSDAIIRILYPRMCGSCGRPIESLALGAACLECWNATEILSGAESSCSKCGILLRGSSATSIETSGTLCGRCDPHLYDRVFSVGIYEKALRAEVLNLKTEPFIGRTAVRLLDEAVGRIGLGFDLVLPVPLARRRQKERGFNQAEVIARALRMELRRKIDTSILKRATHTPIHRAGMDAKSRDATVKKAFVVENKERVFEKRILLVDDVFTSGSTSSQCSRVLKEAGAGSVHVIAIARTR
jgi:competence protein ComFC